MNTDKSIDWLLKAYRNHKSTPTNPNNCVALIEKLKDRSRMEDLIEEAEIEFYDPLAPKEFGDFVILGSVGAGGMGEVFRVRHKKLNRIQALKLLPCHRVENQQASQRFEREMQAIGQLQHPNIVTVHDAGLVDGTPFLAMELIEGQSLAQLVRDHKKNGTTISVNHAVEIIMQAAKGVEHAHKNNVIHRDIKPANLMIDLSGTVKLLDLGLAKVEPSKPKYAVQSQSPESRQLTGQQILGTPDFMAPEQISGKVDERTDIYALGATLYFLLTGQVLFPTASSSLIHKALAITNEVAPSVRKLRADVHDSLGQAIAKSLAKDVTARQQTVAEFVNEIQIATSEFKETVAEKTRNTISESTLPKLSDSRLGEARNSTQEDWAASDKDAHSTRGAGPTPKNFIPNASAASPPFRWTKIGFFALVPLVLLSLSILLLKGPDGSILRVECDDPNVIVQAQWIGEGSETVEPELIRAGDSTKLRIGRWKLEVKGPQVEQAELSQSEVVLKSGQTEIVRVALLPESSKSIDSPLPPNQSTTENSVTGQTPNQNPASINGTAQIAAGNVVGVSPSGKYIVSKAKDSDLHQIIELKTGTVLGNFDALSGVGCDWNADETKLMVAGRQGPRANPLTIVTIVDNDGKNPREWSTRKGGLQPVEMSPAGDRILFQGDGLHMTDLSGNVIESFQPPTESFRGVGVPTHMSPWSPDGSKFAFYDEAAGEMLIYSPDGGKPLKRIKVHRNSYIRFVWLRSGQGFSCLHDVYNLDGTKRPLIQIHDGIVRVFNPEETEWVVGGGVIGTGGVIGLQSGRIRRVEGFFEDGFLFWNQPDVITSVDPKYPGRFREFSSSGKLIREVKPELVVN